MQRPPPPSSAAGAEFAAAAASQRRQYVYVPTQAVPQSYLLAALAGGFVPLDDTKLANNRLTERILPPWRRNLPPGRKQPHHHHHSQYHHGGQKKHPSIIKGTALTRRPAAVNYVVVAARQQQPPPPQPSAAAAAPLMVNVPPSPGRTPRSPPRSDKPSRQTPRPRGSYVVHDHPHADGFLYHPAQPDGPPPGNQDDEDGAFSARLGGGSYASMSTLPLSQLHSTNDLAHASMMEQSRAHAVVMQLLAEPGDDWDGEAGATANNNSNNSNNNVRGVGSDRHDRGDSTTVDLGGRKGPPGAGAAAGAVGKTEPLQGRSAKDPGLSKLAESDQEADGDVEEEEEEGEDGDGGGRGASIPASEVGTLQSEHGLLSPFYPRLHLTRHSHPPPQDDRRNRPETDAASDAQMQTPMPMQAVVDGVILEGAEGDAEERRVPANVSAAVQHTLAMLRGGAGRYDFSGGLVHEPPSVGH